VFAKKEYLEIVERNWPELMEPHKIYGMKVHQFSDTEIRLLRKKGYMTPPVEINGKVYFNPGFGMATSGTSIICAQRADAVVRYLHTVEQAFEQPAEIIAKIYRNTGKKIWDLKPTVKRIEQYPFFVVLEQNSGVFITE
jgi:hypothetical protein